MKRVLLGVSTFIALSISGCTATSLYSNKSLKNINSYNDIQKQIHNGMTMEQVRKKLGRPNRKDSMNGITTWTYTEAKTSKQTFKNILYQATTGRAKMDLKVVQIQFNSAGVVEKINYMEQTQ